MLPTIILSREILITELLTINQDLNIQFIPIVDESALPAHNPARLYLSSLGPGSRPAMSGALQKLASVISSDQCTAETMPWWQLRAPHIKVIRAWLQEEYSPATANKYLAALRQTLQNCWELDLMTTDAYMRAVAVKNLKYKRPEAATGRHITYPELTAILATCINKKSSAPLNANIRDAAIIALTYAAGLRRAEIANLKLADYKPNQNQLIIKDTKHNSTRIVPTEATGLNQILTQWTDVLNLAHQPAAIDAPNTDAPITDHRLPTTDLPLVCRILKSDRMIPNQSISPTAIGEIITKRASQANIHDITPHDFRRTFAGDLLDAGADIATVQKLMGHASTETTASYDRRGERARRAAIAKLKLPLTII